MNQFFFLIFILISAKSFALDVDCKDSSPSLLEKIAAPNPEFKHRGYISPDELNQLSSRQIAELLVKRMHRECDEIRGGKTGKALEEDSDIMMFVPSSALDGIAKFGFQNQHSTRTSNGTNDRGFRYAAENTFNQMILGYGPKSKEVLPKYAALDLKRADNIGQTITPNHYGDVIFVMKKDVKKRTSWTPADSLGYHGFRQSKVPNTLKFKEHKDLNFKCNIYCEAQIWGPLDYSDVEYVMIAPGVNVPESLKTAQIPVYFHKESNSSVKLQKGEIAYEANKKKIILTDPSLINPSNPIEKKILDAKMVSKLSTSELLKKYENTFDIDDKRNILGQISLAKNEESKKFLLQAIRHVSDPISRSEILLGLSFYGHDKEVRGIFRDFIESQNLPTPQSSGMATGMMFNSPPVDLLTAFAIVADTDGFKEDQELRDVIRENVKNNIFLTNWYEHLFLAAPLCKKIDVEAEKKFNSGYYPPFMGADFKIAPTEIPISKGL